MKISPKLIDIVKRGACVLVTSLLIAIPHTGKSETKEESNVNQTKIVQEVNEEPEVSLIVEGEEISVDLNNEEETQNTIEEALMSIDVPLESREQPTFVFVTHWEKTENYSEGGLHSNGNREYKRTAYRFRPNEKFNANYFKEDIELIAKFFRDEEDGKEVFDVLESTEQVITVTIEEEKELETKYDIIEFEGTNFAFKISSQKLVRAETVFNIVKFTLLGIVFLGYMAYMIKAIRE